MSSPRLLCREYTVGVRMEVGKSAHAHGLSPLSLRLESQQVMQMAVWPSVWYTGRVTGFGARSACI